jgi:hypothetical protein
MSNGKKALGQMSKGPRRQPSWQIGAKVAASQRRVVPSWDQVFLKKVLLLPSGWE